MYVHYIPVNSVTDAKFVSKTRNNIRMKRKVYVHLKRP